MFNNCSSHGNAQMKMTENLQFLVEPDIGVNG